MLVELKEIKLMFLKPSQPWRSGMELEAVAFTVKCPWPNYIIAKLRVRSQSMVQSFV